MDGDVIAPDDYELDNGQGASLTIPQHDPLMTRHIQPLYVKVDFNGMEMKRVIFDNDAVVNILPLRTLKKINLEIQDLEKTDTIMTNFIVHDRALEGYIMLNVKVGRHESQWGSLSWM